MNDIIVQENGELLFKNGDIVVDWSHQQHQKHLLLFEKGALKEFPTVGVGSFRYLEAEKQDEYLREVATQFTGDGMKVDKLSYSNGKLIFEADYGPL